MRLLVLTNWNKLVQWKCVRFISIDLNWITLWSSDMCPAVEDLVAAATTQFHCKQPLFGEAKKYC